MDELKDLVTKNKYHIIGITESWARNEIDDSELHIDGYVMYRQDRPLGTSSKGGGVLLYIKNTLHSEPLLQLTNSGFTDSVWAQIKSKGGTSIIGVCYRSTSSTDPNNVKLLQLLEEATQQPHRHIMILGDFNYPSIDYSKLIVNPGGEHAAKEFLDKTMDIFLYQNVYEDTRVRQGQNPSKLDYIFTDEDNLIENLQVLPPLGKSDHACLDFSYLKGSEEDQPNHVKRNYWKADFHNINLTLNSVNWREKLETENVLGAWKIFRDTIDEVCDQYIPLRKVRKRKPRKSEWITKKTTKMIKKRNKAWNKYRTTNSDSDYKAYKELRNKVVKFIRRDKTDYQRKLIQNFKHRPKQFYGYINKMRTVKNKISHIIRQDGSPTVDDQEAASELCSRFSTHFTLEEELTNPLPPGSGLHEVSVTEDHVLQTLLKLKPDKSPGPDNIHPMFLRETAYNIALPLTLIFRKSLDEGVLPEEWKCANITPIHKKGLRSEAENYRPISLTSAVCKVLETIIKKQMTTYLDSEGIITNHQHGFVRGRSCLTNLLYVFEDWTSNLDEGYGVDVIYLDYKKAFDTVPHKRLVNKLEHLGFAGGLLNWLKAFLINRTMRVVVNGSFSAWAVVLSGVPQGSVLGPLLFLLFVNELPDWIKNNICMFADDTKIWTRLTNPTDAESLQKDLDSLSTWSARWQLKFNPEKCKLMHIGHKQDTKYTIRQDNINWNIQEVSEERDLGVLTTCTLKVTRQCQEAVLKANRILGMVHRQFRDLDRKSFLIIYKGFIRPHLEYAIQTWSPYQKGDIEHLEKVQRRATRLVKGYRKLSYEERLRKLGLTTLQTRRLRGDLIETFKIITGKEQVNRETFFQMNRSVYDTRGHCFKLATSRSRLEVRRNFFSQRVISHWNRLPAHVVEADTVNTFKNRLDKEWGN